VSDYNPDDPRLIQAAHESGLDKECDPVLLRFYMVKLFQRNWAGVKTPEEKRYVVLARKALGKGPSEAQIAARTRNMETFRQRQAERRAAMPSKGTLLTTQQAPAQKHGV
jgi:hypothetical protein